MPALTGIPASPGLACGQAALLLQHPLVLRHAISLASVGPERDRFRDALEHTRVQLAEIGARLAGTAASELAHIFEAQLLMLDDRLLVARADDLIVERHINAEWALHLAFQEVSALFAEVGDDYLRERRGDVADVVARIRRNLQAGAGDGHDLLSTLDAGAVLVADDLPPSLTASIDPRRIAALVIEAGSRTHHSAILARSLGIPAVVGVPRATALVKPGDTVLVDGTLGRVSVNPDQPAVDGARTAMRGTGSRRISAANTAPGPALTADGVPVRIEANVELPAEAAAALRTGAQGIGLFRSEYLLGGRAVDVLDEERQARAYRSLLEAMAPLPVTIRTFDIDASPGLGPPAVDGGGGEPSGPLGLRAIRFALAHPDVLTTQLRALVRAARFGTLRILLPLVTGLAEVRHVRARLRTIQAEITAQDGVDPAILIGAMIEVPAAALTVDRLADEVDFFSVGTNDLVQYCLAVDRSHAAMAGWYDPFHPAVLRLIRGVVRSARARGRAVSVCGELAAEPAAIPLLLGLGVTALSMAPASIPGARRAIGAVTLGESVRVARAALRAGTGDDVRALVAAAVTTERPA